MEISATASRSISDELYKSLTLKERTQLIHDLDIRTQLTKEQIERRLKEWKEKALLSDRSLNEKLQKQGITEELFAKVLEVSQTDEWTYTYVLSKEQKPDWMKSLDEAFRLHREQPLAEMDQLHISYAFRPFVIWARTRLNRFYQEVLLSERVDWNPLLTSILEHLVAGLTQIGARTIVLEMYVAKQLNELEGDSPEQRYDSFVTTKLLDYEALEFLYKEYPVLTRLLMVRTEFFVNAIIEVLTRFTRDWEQIKDQLQTYGSPLTSLSAGLGDSHQQGRTVIKCKLASGQEIMYKPKSLSLAYHFNQLLAWFNGKGFKPALKGLRMIERGNYAWEECVIHQGCDKKEQIEYYYKKLGGLLAVLHVVGGADFHSENIIAGGEFPFLIDLETIFHHAPQLNIEETADVETKYKVVNSVLGTGLLPHLYFRTADGQGMDMGGISAKEQELPMPVLRVENEGTDEMCFVRKKIKTEVSTQNVPKLNAQAANAAEYVDFIVAGFKEAAHIIIKHKKEFIGEKGPMDKFKEDVIRIIVRPTQYYMNFNMEAQHPDYLRDARDREQLLDRLWFTILDTRQTFYEQQDLFDGDIPFFTTSPGSTDLVSSRGERLPQFYAKPSYDIAIDRITKLTEEHIDEQAEWIEASVVSQLKQNITFEPREVSTKDLIKADHALFVEEAKKIGFRLLDKAVYGKKDGASWIGLEANYHGQWQVSAVERGLYNGLSGIGLFLAYLAQMTGETTFRKLAIETVETIIQGRIFVKDFASAFYGNASIIYTLSHFLALYGEHQDWQSYLEMSIDNIGKSVEDDGYYDLLGGGAGIIQVLLNAYEQFGSEQALLIARGYGDHLLKNKVAVKYGVGWKAPVMQSSMLGGFAHGTSGIAWSLLRLHQATRKEEYYDTALSAIQYDRTLYDSEKGNWLDLREEQQSGTCAAAWCHGAAGIGLSRLLYRSYVNDPIMTSEIETAVTTTARSGMGRNHALCHGDLGNAELFHMAGTLLGRADWTQLAQTVGMRVIQEKQVEGKYRTAAPRYIEVPGLFLGLSGIGYQLLRLARPDQIPSVLTLEKAAIK